MQLPLLGVENIAIIANYKIGNVKFTAIVSQVSAIVKVSIFTPILQLSSQVSAIVKVQI